MMDILDYIFGTLLIYLYIIPVFYPALKQIG